MFKKLIPLTVFAALISSAAAQLTVESFTLINADTDQPIAGFDPISDGASIGLASLPTRNLNIRANAGSTQVASVRFDYNGTTNENTDSALPFAFKVDDAGNYRPWTPALGSHTITATPYFSAGGVGRSGSALVVNFTVNNSDVSAGAGEWIESGGVVVIEPENGDLGSTRWVARPTNHGSDPSMAGSKGNGWLEWTGPFVGGNTISDSKAQGVLTYDFNITTPGVYVFRWRSKQYGDVEANDAGNDTYVKFASGTPVSGFQDFSSFSKVYIQSKNNWSWGTNFEPHHAEFYNGDKARRNYTAGKHTIQLAGRSAGHSIDRIVLHRTSVPFNEGNFNNLPESARGGGGGPSLVYDATTDFASIGSGDVPYYKDTARNALAINASNASYRNKFARATTTFDGEAGKYDVTITALGELDGECSYRLLVNGFPIGTKQNQRVGTDYAPIDHTFFNVDIPVGATLAVESNNVSNGLVPEGDIFAFARGRWTTLSLAPTTVTGVPEVDAGTDQVLTLPTNSVTLIGSAIDYDGSISTYRWSQVSGPSDASTRQSRSNYIVSSLVQGTYKFRLDVIDNEGEAAFDEVLVTVIAPGTAAVVVSGELKRWHDVILTLDGPNSSEDATPNPFYDTKFDVVFTHPASGLSYQVPGYFAADGNAGETSATSGNKWRAHLSPDEIGTWNYQVVFRQGSNAALGGLEAGTPIGTYHGVSGSFEVAETDKELPDFRARGRLQYVNKHHLQFKGDGSYFIKAGPDSPENLFAYEDFDNTPNTGSRRKSWQPHQRDYVAGDPTWKNGKGSELIGAINYLASEGLNVMSFLTYSYNGDDKNVFPHRTAGDYTRMDCSKLDQWGIALSHAQKKGIYLHFKTQETENDQNLDGGSLGNQRKLYYRELVARYGQHLALNWNLGEENTNTVNQRKEFAQWFYDNDPYRHNVVIHSFPDQQDIVYNSLLGNASKITGASVQTNKTKVFQDTKRWLENSANASKPWVVANDEQGPANEGIKADSNDAAHNAERGNVLWGNIMAGGAGIESYFGYQQPETDLSLQNFRSRDLWWDQCRHALRFIEDNGIPFWEMSNTDNLISSSGNNANHCLSKPGEVYVVYLRNGGRHTLNLSGMRAQTFDVNWYNPRTGGELIRGASVTSGSSVSLGSPPNTTTQDWVALVAVPGFAQGPEPLADAGPDQTMTLPPLSIPPFFTQISGSGSDTDGTVVGYAWSQVEGPSVASISAGASATMSGLVPGNYVFRLTVTDNDSNTGTDDMRLRVVAPGQQVPFEDTAYVLPGRIQIEGYDYGGEGISYHDTTKQKLGTGAGFRPDDSVDLEQISAGQYRSGGVEAGEWLEYTVNVSQAGLYQTNVRSSSTQNGALCHLSLDGEPVGGFITAPNTGTADALQTHAGPIVSLPAGLHVVRFQFDQGVCYPDWFEFVPVAPASGGSVSLDPTHDAYTQNGSNFNNGDLRIENSNRKRIAYLQFNVPAIGGSVAGSTLSLTEGTDVSGGAMTLRVYAGNGNNWTEGNVSSANAPTKGSQLDSYTGDIGQGAVVNFDLGNHISGPGQYSFIIEADSSNLDLAFASKEAGGNGPKLQITVVDPNQPPTFAGYSINMSVGQTANVSFAKLLAKTTDPENDEVFVVPSQGTSAKGGQVTMGTGTLSYQPPANFNGPDSWQLTFSDAKGATTTGTLQITVNPGSVSSSMANNPAKLTMQPGNHAKVSFHGIPGFSYDIERSTNMTDWEVIETVVAQPDGSLFMVDANPPKPSAYYRLRFHESGN